MTHSQIVDGPGKYDLMIALFDRRSDRPRTVCFKIKHEISCQTIKVIAHIVSVSIEDGSGESWIIELQTKDFRQYHNGYYSTKTREGVLRPGLRNDNVSTAHARR